MSESTKILLRYKEIALGYFSKEELQKALRYFNNERQISKKAVSLLKNKYADDSRESYFYRNLIENFLTFADSKLELNQFFDLLLNFAKTAVSTGDLNLGQDIYLVALSKASNKKAFKDIRANAYLGLGEICLRQSFWTDTLKHLRKGLNIFLSEKNFNGAAKCENLIGSLYGNRGEFDKAKNHFEKSLKMIDAKKERHLTGMIEGNLAIVSQAQKDYNTAFAYHYRALNNFEQINDNKGIALARYNLGFLFLQKKEFDSAKVEFDLSISAAIKNKYLSSLNLAFLGISEVYLKLKDFPLALAFSDRALEISFKINDRLTVADLYKIKGIIQRELKNNEFAENYLHTSLRINKETGNKLNYAETCYELGILYENWKNESAVHFLKEALNSYKEIDIISEEEKIKSKLKELAE